MTTISPQQARQRWDIVSESIRAVMVAPESSLLIEKIGEAEHIPKEKNSEISRIASYVLLGFIHPEEMKQEIQERLGIDPRVAQSIADALQSRLFAPLKSGLQIIYAPITEGPAPLPAMATKLVEETKKAPPLPAENKMAPAPVAPKPTASTSAPSLAGVVPTSTLSLGKSPAPSPVTTPVMPKITVIPTPTPLSPKVFSENLGGQVKVSATPLNAPIPSSPKTFARSLGGSTLASAPTQGGKVTPPPPPAFLSKSSVEPIKSNAFLSELSRTVLAPQGKSSFSGTVSATPPKPAQVHMGTQSMGEKTVSRPIPQSPMSASTNPLNPGKQMGQEVLNVVHYSQWTTNPPPTTGTPKNPATGGSSSASLPVPLSELAARVSAPQIKPIIPPVAAVNSVTRSAMPITPSSSMGRGTTPSSLSLQVPQGRVVEQAPFKPHNISILPPTGPRIPNTITSPPPPPPKNTVPVSVAKNQISQPPSPPKPLAPPAR